MKQFYEINHEKFRCEPAARHHFDELKLEARENERKHGELNFLELWEVSEQQDIFGNVRQVKQLVTRHTPCLPNNGVFRIHDVYDVRRAKKLYSLQKYDSENNCWNNFKLGNTVEELQKFMLEFVEVK